MVFPTPPSIINPIPNSPFYSPPSNQISTPTGGIILGSGVSIDQYGVMNVASALGGTLTSVTAGPGLSTNGSTTGGSITVAGTLSLLPPQGSSIGGVKAGANVTIAADGTLSVAPPGTGTLSSIAVGAGLTGGGTGPAVTINLSAASTSQFGGVIVNPDGGINVIGGSISLVPASTTQIGGVTLATSAEVIAGTNDTKAITSAGLAAKVASPLVPGIVQLSNSVSLPSSYYAATSNAVKTAYDVAVAAQDTASAALPLSGGTLTGIIDFAVGQTFPDVALPVATTSSSGVVKVGAGLAINVSGVLRTVNNGTVTAVTTGPGLGAPATGNVITTSGTIRLLPPTTDGLQLGGVKAGSNVTIAVDGTISAAGVLQTNNPYAYNSYIFPVAAVPSAAPGVNGSFLQLVNRVTGEVAWATNNGITSITAGTGLTGGTITTSGTIALATSGVIADTYGATGLIPTITVDNFGRVISGGEANPYAPFQIATQTAPPDLVLNFADNNTNWEWTLLANTVMKAPTNAESGQTGAILIRQNSLTPYVLTWDAEWNWGGFTPVPVTPVASAVDMYQFTVYASNYIVITNVIQNIG